MLVCQVRLLSAGFHRARLSQPKLWRQVRALAAEAGATRRGRALPRAQLPSRRCAVPRVSAPASSSSAHSPCAVALLGTLAGLSRPARRAAPAPRPPRPPRPASASPRSSASTPGGGRCCLLQFPFRPARPGPPSAPWRTWPLLLLPEAVSPAKLDPGKCWGFALGETRSLWGAARERGATGRQDLRAVCRRGCSGWTRRRNLGA